MIKYCPKCEQEKDVSEFNLNASRSDGYSYCCKWCRKYAEPTYSRRQFEDVEKPCCNCGRVLPRRMFRYSQNTEDCLTDDCRSCRLFRTRSGPTLKQVEEFECSLEEIIRTAKRSFDPASERLLFEELVFKLFHQRGLNKDWKLPLWVNSKLFKDG